jgi:hypothetical protein
VAPGHPRQPRGDARVAVQRRRRLAQRRVHLERK